MYNPSLRDNARDTGGEVPSGRPLNDGIGNNNSDGIPNQADDGIESGGSPQTVDLQNDTT